MATLNSILCQTASEWREEVRERNLQGKSLAVCPNNLESGSRVTEEQFLLFRTLFPPTRGHFDANLFGLSVEYQQAGVLLLGSADFQAYLQRISATSLSQWHQDTLFKVPLAQQQQAVLPGGSKLTRRSESVVNVSIISYLQALAMVATPISGEWSASRISLQADFGSGRRFTAVTDGQLQEVTTKRILALVECKRDQRLRHSPQVEFQETAQMVAWIREFPDAAPRPWRALVSQDGSEIYVSIFEYGRSWKSYLNGGNPQCASHAKMHRFGPYRIGNRAGMAEFARIIIAIMLSV
ncbi:hypothetical protein DTO271D3_2529 [Paecilomyces variotii]|nr:hypothetical protein DTO271D3_2529 [Paecilomyces variotii]